MLDRNLAFGVTKERLELSHALWKQGKRICIGCLWMLIEGVLTVYEKGVREMDSSVPCTSGNV